MRILIPVPDLPAAIRNGRRDGMATAGSGDVLSGVITGINSQNGADLCLNAACGAYICGVAGEYAQKEKNAVSMTASDTVANIHRAVSEILDA